MPFDFRNFLAGNSQPLLRAGVGILSGQTPQQQVALGAQGFSDGINQNQTVEYLRRYYPELAEGVKMGAITPAQGFQAAWETRTKTTKPRDNLIGVGKNLYNAETGQWISPPAGMASDNEEYGLNPQYGVDKDGNPVILQLSKGGTSHQTQLPPGITLSKEPIKLDAGTHFVLLDPITRQPIGTVPKDLAGAASQQAIGKAQGEAAFTLPASVQQAEQTVKQIDELANSDGLDSIVGGMDQYRPSWTLGASGRDALTRYNQLKGRSFLQAYDMLKGGGQITEVEGQKAQDAMARMDRSLSESDFRVALKDFRDAVESGIQKLKAQAGVAPQQGAVMQQGSTGQPMGVGQTNATSSGIQWRVK